MKKLFSVTLSVLCLIIFCFSGCNKSGPIPNGCYSVAHSIPENPLPENYFMRTERNIRDSFGWVIDGDIAEEWVSGSCEYKAKIVKKNGKILFDGYRWRGFLDDKEGRGSDHDYIVVYNEVSGSITLTPKPAKENTEYVFDGITFEKSNGLKIEDLRSFIPAIQVKEIKTIKDFENLILDNLDSYSLNMWKNGKREQVYFYPKYHSITVKTGNILSLTEKEGGIPQEISCTPITSGRRWEYMTENEDFRWDCSSTFSYIISFPMDIPNYLESPKYFRVVYNYKAK